LSDRSLRVDGPSHDEIALDSGMRGQRFLVAGSRLVTVRDDDGTNVFGRATRVMQMRPDPTVTLRPGTAGRRRGGRSLTRSRRGALRARG
jgi:hypothetical protein